VLAEVTPYIYICIYIYIYIHIYSIGGVLAEVSPVHSVMDDMVSRACSTRTLNCYKLRLPVFAQDLRWYIRFFFGGILVPKV
jgi:hypothetical protein